MKMEKLETLFASHLMEAITTMNARKEFWYGLKIETSVTLEEVNIYGAQWKITIWGSKND